MQPMKPSNLGVRELVLPSEFDVGIASSSHSNSCFACVGRLLSTPALSITALFPYFATQSSSLTLINILYFQKLRNVSRRMFLTTYIYQ